MRKAAHSPYEIFEMAQEISKRLRKTSDCKEGRSVVDPLSQMFVS